MGDIPHSQDEVLAPDRPSADSLPGASSSPTAEEPAAGPAQTSLPATTTLVPPHGPLSDAQRDAVARMVVQGRPLNLIAMAVGRSPDALRRMVAGSLAPKIEEVRALVLRETSAHWFEMLAMLPQARLNMQSALLSNDEQTRVAMSKWLHERIVPAPTQHHEVEQTIHLGEGVTELLTAMTARLDDIARDNAGRDPLARVKTGAEALPRVLQVLPGGSPDDDGAA